MASKVRIEFAERRVEIDGVPTRLRPKAFDVMAVMASRPGHLFSKESLIDRVWAGRSISSDVLPGCIRELRKALGDKARTPEWIETVPGTGYRLLQTPELLTTGKAHVSEPVGADTSIAACETNSAAICVLPFGIRTIGTERVAQALARDITLGLARTRWLTVTASATAEVLAGSSDRETTARTLDVAYVVEGNLYNVADTLDLRIALIHAKSDRVLWADRLNRQGKDVDRLIDEICDVVVSAVEREIELFEQKRAIIAPIRGVEPWLGLHRGMNLLQRQDATTLAAADHTLRAAARSDPACARVAAARSWHAWQELFFGTARDRETSLDKARELALESIDLDAQDPLGHWALGRARWLSGDLEAAAENLECAVSLNPSFAIGHYSLGYTLYLFGRNAEAMRSCDTAIRLSPLDPMAFAFHCIKAHILCFEGETAPALHHARRIADHPNAHAFALAVAAWVNDLCGNRAAATECISRIHHRWPSYSRGDYMKALFHQSPWYPIEKKRAIEGSFDRLGF